MPGTPSGEPAVHAFVVFSDIASVPDSFDWEGELSSLAGVAGFERRESAPGDKRERIDLTATTLAANMLQSKVEGFAKVSATLSAALSELADSLKWAVETPFECEDKMLGLAEEIRANGGPIAACASRNSLAPQSVEACVKLFADSVALFARASHAAKKRIDWVEFEPAAHPQREWRLALSSVLAHCLELHMRATGFHQPSRLTRDISGDPLDSLFQGFFERAQRLEAFAPPPADDAPARIDPEAAGDLFADLAAESGETAAPEKARAPSEDAGASKEPGPEEAETSEEPKPLPEEAEQPEQSDEPSAGEASAPLNNGPEAPKAPAETSPEPSPEASAARPEPTTMSSEDKNGPLHWKTAITKIEPNEIRLRGYRVDELMGRVSFTRGVYLALRGELPSEAVGKLLDAILVSSIDHGATPPSALAAIQAASTGAPLNAALASGVLAINQHHGGAVEGCMRTIREGLHRVGQGVSAEEAGAAIVSEAKAAKKRLAGFGHRLHTEDPRAPRLFELAEEAGVAAEPVALLRAIEKALAESREGKPLPINVDGAIAGVLVGLGFGEEMANLFFILGRVAGMAAHIDEEWSRQRPMRRIHPTDHEYDGPADRSLDD